MKTQRNEYFVLDQRCQDTYDVVIRLINFLDVHDHQKEVLIDNIDHLVDLLITYGNTRL